MTKEMSASAHDNLSVKSKWYHIRENQENEIKKGALQEKEIFSQGLLYGRRTTGETKFMMRATYVRLQYDFVY